MHERGLEEEREEMEETIKKALMKVEKKIGKEKKEKSGWWDKKCKLEKKQVKKKLREWRRKGGNGEEYKRKKREYKELCDKKKKENSKWERRAEEVKKEDEVWEIINKKKKKRRKIDKRIEMIEWKEHFMGVIEGTKERIKEKKGSQGKEEEEEVEISKEELKKAIKRLKDGKATGLDEVPAEVRKYGGERMKDWLCGFCNRVWRREGWPEVWKKGVIVAIVKKEERERAED